jgi:CRP/FNR family transcriptional regulator, cyclic AMP receptor protein
MPDRRTAPLLDLDPELGILLPAERRADARGAIAAEVLRVGTGAWSADRLAGASPDHMGLLLVSGVVSREVVVADTVSTELLGPRAGWPCSTAGWPPRSGTSPRSRP